MPVTVQNLPLLRAATNSNPYSSRYDLVSPTLVGNEAILHENRPLNIARTTSSSDSSSPSDAYVFEASDQISIYVVHDGDTIPEVAKMYGVTANTIRWANDLGTKDSIKKNQKLIILPISGVKYVVKKGDNIKTIAKAFKGDQSEIIAFNGLEGASDIKVGDEIIIPNGEMTAISPSSVSKPQNLASKGSNSGYFMRPVIGGTKTQGIHGHNGIDIGSKKGTSILAAASGKVIIAKQGGSNGGYGNYVVISHPNGMQTLYGHLNSVNVKQGQSVTKGDVLGGMGNTGDSSGVHLHFEVRGGANPF